MQTRCLFVEGIFLSFIWRLYDSSLLGGVGRRRFDDLRFDQTVGDAFSLGDGGSLFVFGELSSDGRSQRFCKVDDECIVSDGDLLVHGLCLRGKLHAM